MKVIPQIRNEWIMRLFSTQAADRPRASSAVGDLYLVAGFEPPQHFLWFESPFHASWAVALLLRSHSAIWRQTLESTERSSSGRESLARASEDVCRQVGASSWDAAVTAVGRPLGQHWVQPDFCHAENPERQRRCSRARGKQSHDDFVHGKGECHQRARHDSGSETRHNHEPKGCHR